MSDDLLALILLTFYLDLSDMFILMSFVFGL